MAKCGIFMHGMYILSNQESEEGIGCVPFITLYPFSFEAASVTLEFKVFWLAWHTRKP